MAMLNRDAAQAMSEVGVHAVTDVTGFGLLGHLLEMTQASKVSAEIFAGTVPTIEEAWEYVRKGKIPAATHTNLKYVNPHLRYDNGLPPEMALMLADPQTAGGLLISVPSNKSEQLIERF